MKILVYGCYGYTGRLIAEHAAQHQIPVVVCGRNPSKVAEVAEATGLPSSVASLDDPASLDQALQDVAAVIHCAGPFVDTWVATAEAAQRTRAPPRGAPPRPPGRPAPPPPPKPHRPPRPRRGTPPPP